MLPAERRKRVDTDKWRAPASRAGGARNGNARTSGEFGATFFSTRAQRTLTLHSCAISQLLGAPTAACPVFFGFGDAPNPSMVPIPHLPPLNGLKVTVRRLTRRCRLQGNSDWKV